MNKEVIEKVKKLLALSKSSNEHEASTAMLQVQKLLVKYKLSMREIEEFEGKQTVNVVEDLSDISTSTGRWKVVWRWLFVITLVVIVMHKLKIEKAM